MRALIVGCGSAGRRHLHNLRTLGLSDFVLYRTYQSTLPDDELAGLPTETDLERALAHKPQIAIIANPTALHIPVALAAARTGCHLFIEKPLSHSMAGCSDLQNLVRQRRLVTMIGCQFRFHPLLSKLSEQLQVGRIGEVIGVRVEWGEYLPDWHPWEDHRRSYSARRDMGGGVILTLIHPLDYLYWLFGPVKWVCASVRSIPSLQTDTPDDLAEITIEFASGIVGQVHLDFLQRPPVHALTVLGDQGRAIWDYHDGTLRWEHAKGKRLTERVPDGFERNTMFVEELRHFLTCIERHRPTRIPLEEGVTILEIALQARRDALERNYGQDERRYV